MGSINLADELNYKSIEVKSDSNSAGMDYIVTKVIDYFVNNKPVLINDVEKGNLPFTAIEKEIEYFIDTNDVSLNGITKEKISENVYNYLYKYYVLQDYLEDDRVTGMRLIKKNNIWIKKIVNGEPIDLEVSDDINFSSDESFERFCNYIARRNRAEINKKNTINIITDKKRCDNAILRINLTSDVINSSDLPCVIIRKTPKEKLLLDDLEKRGMIDYAVKEYLKEKVKAGAQILVCGAGGSGKTYLLNALLEEIEDNIHGVFIQESEELYSDKRKNLTFQRIKKKSSEGDTECNLEQITRNAMVMSADLICIGEIKGAEAFDLFNAAYSGHIAWSSLHTESDVDTLPKLIQYMQYGHINLDEKRLLEMLSKIDAVIMLQDFKVKELTEITGFDRVKSEVLYNKVFKYDYKNEKFKRLNNTCERLQEKVDYYYYKKRRRELCCS
ncbi:MAG: ATPase, T2SS/T4P/T4SS family [Cetobacterium sp.]|uniref:ATPase, T2SS/T4P/T4SS family n=1 Tax=Bacteria TaxID=2 RepID=UPI002FCBC740